MLKALSVRNVVLIDQLDLEFSGGLGVLSGETGAGKSILLDSIGLLIGKRAEIGLIRQGADKLMVSGVFEILDQDNPFFSLCAENDIEIEGDIIIKRSLDRAGKSKIFINDQPVSLRFLKEIGSCLVEIHGQFDNQGLLNPATHLDALDMFGAYKPLLLKTSESFKVYKESQTRLHQAQSAYNSAAMEEENLRHWTDELEKAKIRPHEEAELNQRRAEIMHAEKLIENLNIAYSSLQGHNIGALIQKAEAALARVNALTDNRFEDIAEALNSALIQLDEATSRIEQVQAEINLNANEADAVEERLFSLRALSRKHQVSIDELGAKLAEFQAKLASLDKGGAEIADLEEKTAQAYTTYLKAAKDLSTERQKAAKALSSAVMAELLPLKMERAIFEVTHTPLQESEFSAKGIDRIIFTVATNPNSPQGPLNKIASGGELARFMLALKVNLAQKASAETLIFDEIDTGIGGAAAQAVGERLSRLSKSLQVLVVTHSPQIASFSHEHFKVSKVLEKDQNYTKIQKLTSSQKQEEIARMLSGEEVSREARAAAAVLIKGKGVK